MSLDDYKLSSPPNGKSFSYGKEPEKEPAYLKRIEGTDLYITRYGVLLYKDGKEVKTDNIK